jgi:hypothetical protein
VVSEELGRGRAKCCAWWLSGRGGAEAGAGAAELVVACVGCVGWLGGNERRGVRAGGVRRTRKELAVERAMRCERELGGGLGRAARASRSEPGAGLGAVVTWTAGRGGWGGAVQPRGAAEWSWEGGAGVRSEEEQRDASSEAERQEMAVTRRWSGPALAALGPALVGAPALAGLRSGFSRFVTFREISARAVRRFGGNWKRKIDDFKRNKRNWG